MKRIFYAFLSLLLLLLPLMTSCQKETPEPQGTPETVIKVVEEIVNVETPFKYSVNDGKVTLLKYTGTDADLKIPETIGEYPVEAIGTMAFANLSSLTSVEIPGTLKTTGDLAFYHCENLTKVTMGEGIEAIGYGTFAECAKLSDVVFPDSLKLIGASGFKGCLGLKSIDFNKVEYIEDAAFNHTGLTSVTVPVTVKETAEEIFMECHDLVSVRWESNANLREKTFAYCEKLADVQLTGGFGRVYDYCFTYCTSLKTLVFPEYVNRYYSHALYACTALETITMKNPYMDRIYDMAFHFLPSLTDIYFAGSEDTWNSMNVSSPTFNEGLRLATVHFNSAS